MACPIDGEPGFLPARVEVSPRISDSRKKETRTAEFRNSSLKNKVICSTIRYPDVARMINGDRQRVFQPARMSRSANGNNRREDNGSCSVKFVHSGRVTRNSSPDISTWRHRHTV